MPSAIGVHIDRALTNFSLKYTNNSFIADTLAPRVPVQKESDKYFVYGKQNFRTGFALRAEKALTREVGYTLSTQSYQVEDYGFHEVISDRERDNADDPLRPDYDATEHLTDTLMLDRELRVSSKVLDSTDADWTVDGTNYSTTHFSNLAAAYNDLAGSDPRADLYYAKYAIFKDSRKVATDVFIPVEVSFQLSQMNMIDELRKYTDPGLMTNSGLPSKLWGLQVHECQSAYDSAEEMDTFDLSETYGTNMIVAHIAKGSIGLKSLTFMLTFQRKAFATRKWRDEPRLSDIVEVGHMEDVRIVAPTTGFVFLNAMTTQF